MKLSNVLKSTAIAAITASAGITMSAYATDEEFDIGGRLIEPITITEVQGLGFPEQVAGTLNPVTVLPDDSLAAQFTAAGEPDRNITMIVVEGSVVISTASGGTAATEITVDNFSFGGNSNIAPDGSSAFDSNGALTNIRV
ncbi:MAG: hypothetical protein ACI8WB_006204, partial [Phenylobacterium sp.]